MTNLDLFENTPPHKLHRADAPETSVKAARKVKTARMLALVHDEIKGAGANGITAKEILAKHPSLPYSSITARPKQLEEDGLIFYQGDKRNGARVMRLRNIAATTEEYNE